MRFFQLYSSVQYFTPKINHPVTKLRIVAYLIVHFSQITSLHALHTYLHTSQVNLSIHDLARGQRKGYFRWGKSGLQIAQVVRRQLLLVFFLFTDIFTFSGLCPIVPMAHRHLSRPMCPIAPARRSVWTMQEDCFCYSTKWKTLKVRLVY